MHVRLSVRQIGRTWTKWTARKSSESLSKRIRSGSVSASPAGIRADDSRHTFYSLSVSRCRWRRRWPKPFRPVTNRWRLRRYLTVEHRTYRKSVCSWTPHWIIPWPQSSVSGFWSELYPRRMHETLLRQRRRKSRRPSSWCSWWTHRIYAPS